MENSLHHADPWSSLRRHTSARIALGRAGGSLPTAALLDFAVAHAAARDAVHAELDLDRLEASLSPLGLPCLKLGTVATNRQLYLQFPDLGRRLDDASHERLAGCADASPDLAIVIADGLSAPAAQRQAFPLLIELLPLLKSEPLRIGPLVLVRNARVALQDEVGFALKARLALILIGERPGLSTAESLGAYLVYDPRLGRTDADRNCVSNIRAGGLTQVDAAAALHYLTVQSLRRRTSGVGLKDERPAVLLSKPEGALPGSES